MEKTTEPIVVEQNFNTSTGNVWQAITALDQMKQWFFSNIPAFNAEVGFETRFNVKTPDRDFMHIWKITEVIPEQKITYHWSYEKYPGEGYVTFELTGLGNGAKLRLTAIGMESFPQDIPEFTRESCLGGWNYFITERLKEYLEK